MVNPFLSPLGGSRSQFNQPQQNQYDFSGWGDRLNKIEEGIAGLTKQFNSFQTPGDVAPEYTGNATPEPLEQPTNETGIGSLTPIQDTMGMGMGMDRNQFFQNIDPRLAGDVLGRPKPESFMEQYHQMGKPYFDPSEAVINERWHPSFGTPPQQGQGMWDAGIPQEAYQQNFTGKKGAGITGLAGMAGLNLADLIKPGIQQNNKGAGI